MAHRNLIGGTSYDTKGGRCLVDGTGYAIKKGRALIGGTGYDIPFDTPVIVTITGNGLKTSNGVAYASATINGTNYTAAASGIAVAPGDVIELYIRGDSRHTGYVYVNNVQKYSVTGSSGTHNFTVPEDAAEITIALAAETKSVGTIGIIRVTY